MTMFVAIRSLPGITADALQGAGARVEKCAAAMHDEGTDVRWVRSFFLPASSETHCYFDGPSMEAVAQLNARAGLPYERIVEVSEMKPVSS